MSEGATSKPRGRDSVFLSATVKAADGSMSDVFRIRNISSGGAMAEGPIIFAPGDLVQLELRHIGLVSGSIAWVYENRMGIQFNRMIDPLLVRKPVGRNLRPGVPSGASRS